MKYNAFVFLFMILIGCNMPEVKTGKPLSYHSMPQPEFGKHRSRWVTDASD